MPMLVLERDEALPKGLPRVVLGIWRAHHGQAPMWMVPSSAVVAPLQFHHSVLLCLQEPSTIQGLAAQQQQGAMWMNAMRHPIMETA